MLQILEYWFLGFAGTAFNLHGTARCGTLRHATARYGTLRHAAARYGTVPHAAARGNRDLATHGGRFVRKQGMESVFSPIGNSRANGIISHVPSNPQQKDDTRWKPFRKR